MAIETRDLAALTPAQVSALRSSQLEALTTDEIVALKAGSAAAMETAQVALFTSGRQSGLFYAAPNGMKLHEFFGVSERTVRRWEAAGADLTSAPRLLAFLRNLARPSESVERLLEDFDCERRLVSLLNATEPEESHEDKLKALAGDPGFEPFFTLPDAEEGDDNDNAGGGAFEAWLMADLRQALTGFGILVRMLEHGDRPDPDHMDKAFKGDARVVLADGGPRITDRDLVAVVVAAEHLTAAQIHRFKKVAEMMIARGR